MINERKRSKEPSSLFHDHYSLMVEEYNYIEKDDIIDDPKTYKEAMSLEDSIERLEAMKDEISSNEKNNVWELIDLLKD